MIAILKYNAGNISSVQNAVSRLGFESIITDKPDEILAADKVIFPGVGEASTAMKYLKDRELDKLIRQIQSPLLGICLGQQLLCRHSEEGDTDCIGIFETLVKKFPPNDKVPHIGWNFIYDYKSQLFNNLTLNSDVYFVHSYYAEICVETAALSNYILPFSAALYKNNFYATQFHPEKSAMVGETILRNFLTL